MREWLQSNMRRRIALGSLLKKKNMLLLFSFLTALSSSFVGTIWALYLYTIFGNESTVGFIEGLLTLLSLVTFIIAIPMIERYDTNKIFKWALIVTVVSLILLGLSVNPLITITGAILLSIVYVFRVDSSGILVRDNTTLKEIGTTEGVLYTVADISWTFGPIIAGFIVVLLGINNLFFISAFLMFLALIMILFSKLKAKPRIQKKIDENFWENLKDFFKNSELRKLYFISGGLEIWWVITFIYIPIYMVSEGLNVQHVAIFLFLLMFPMIFLEHLFGKLADKKGYKKLFVLGYGIMGAIFVAAFFVQNIYIFLSLFILGSIGSSMIGSPTEALFFIQVPKRHEEKYYSIYNTTNDLFYMVTILVIAALFLVLSFHWILLLLSIPLLALVGISFLLKKIK